MEMPDPFFFNIFLTHTKRLRKLSLLFLAKEMLMPAFVICPIIWFWHNLGERAV
jgi:hypothetical protein